MRLKPESINASNFVKSRGESPLGSSFSLSATGLGGTGACSPVGGSLSVGCSFIGPVSYAQPLRELMRHLVACFAPRRSSDSGKVAYVVHSMSHGILHLLRSQVKLRQFGRISVERRAGPRQVSCTPVPVGPSP